MNPFDYINSINSTKKDIMVDDLAEKGYNPFITNRSLSYFPDTVLLANEMNRYHHLDKKLQYHFFINTIRKRKRFAKFIKPSEVQDIEVIKEYYGYSDEKAKQVLSLLNGSQLSELHLRINKGGKSK
jgi:hypothetical protein